MEDTKQIQIFVADIGGTNANFGIVSHHNGTYTLIDHYTLPSQKIVDFTKTVQDLLEKIATQKHMRFSAMVIGIAGAICGEQHAVQPTNLPFKIDKALLSKATGIQDILFINDFVTVACGYDHVENTLAITRVAIKKEGQKAFIGAGTGLGQSYAVYSKPLEAYIPLASEGGHSSFAASGSFDNEFALFIQHKELLGSPISWENILSGRGISHIYDFLGSLEQYEETDISREISQGRFQPDFISRYSESDERCKQTFKRYVAYYARYAQQVALQGVACGGLYIAGGIAAKNKKLFLDQGFLNIFTDHAKHRKLLEKIPIFLIQDYQVSLYGGAHYYTLRSRGIL